MTTKVALSEEARELVGRIADDIVRLGHSPSDVGEYTYPRCVTTSPSWKEVEYSVGFVPGSPLEEVIEHFGGDLSDIWKWNDNTPKAEVLARLRSISRGEL